MLRFIQRRRIKKVIKLMSTRLIVGYGSREYFSVGQVKTSTSELSLSACQQKIALALYANPQDLDLENHQNCKQYAQTWRMISFLVPIIPLKMCLIYSALVAGKAVEWKMECLIILVCTVDIKNMR